MMKSENIILSAQQIEKNYDKLEVLKNLNLDVHQGEVVVIIGPSGCGKAHF